MLLQLTPLFIGNNNIGVIGCVLTWSTQDYCEVHSPFSVEHSCSIDWIGNTQERETSKLLIRL